MSIDAYRRVIVDCDPITIDCRRYYHEHWSWCDKPFYARIPIKGWMICHSVLGQMLKLKPPAHHPLICDPNRDAVLFPSEYYSHQVPSQTACQHQYSTLQYVKSSLIMDCRGLSTRLMFILAYICHPHLH